MSSIFVSTSEIYMKMAFHNSNVCLYVCSCVGWPFNCSRMPIELNENGFSELKIIYFENTVSEWSTSTTSRMHAPKRWLHTHIYIYIYLYLYENNIDNFCFDAINRHIVNVIQTEANLWLLYDEIETNIFFFRNEDTYIYYCVVGKG